MLELEDIKIEKVKYLENLNTQSNSNTKHNLKKVYHSLISMDNLLEFVSRVFNLNLDEKELLTTESKNKNYTYLAYSYFDDNNNMISIDNISISINPIFYYLSNARKEDVNYQEFVEEFNINFAPIVQTKIRYIPDTSSLIEYAKKYKSKKNIFENIFPANSYLYITSAFLNELDGLKLDKYKGKPSVTSKAAKKVSKDLLDLLDNEDNTINIIKEDKVLRKNEYGVFLNSSNDEEIVNFAKNIALKYENDFIYIYTLDVNQAIFTKLQKIKNLFSTNFVNNNIAFNHRAIPNSKKAILEVKSNLIKYLKFIQQKELFEETIYGIEQIVSETQFKNLSFDFPNFYLETLEQKVSYNGIKYLHTNNNPKDIQNSLSLKKELNLIKNIPSARWCQSYNLYYSQQNAVNIYLLNFNKNEIVSVNGAAGTGKTTLVKDVVANILYMKANKVICDNFTIIHKERLKKDYIGEFDILITSNNNFAVENITKELPKLSKFDFEYINKSAKDFLLHEFSNSIINSSFGLISIALGKQDNISLCLGYIESLNNYKDLDNIIKIAKSSKASVVSNFNKNKQIISDFKDLFTNELEQRNKLKVIIKECLSCLEKLKQDKIENNIKISEMICQPYIILIINYSKQPFHFVTSYFHTQLESNYHLYYAFFLYYNKLLYIQK